MQDRPRIAIAVWPIAIAVAIATSCAAQPAPSDLAGAAAAGQSASPLDGHSRAEASPSGPAPDDSAPTAPPRSLAPHADASAAEPSTPPATPDPSPPLSPWEPFGQTVVELRSPDGAAHRMPVYVAATPAARGLGLMGRDDLPAGAGMLFLFDREGRPSFWMKDTPLPLSIAFFDSDGRLLSVMDMDPCEADPCPRHAPSADYASAIEAHQGFFQRLGAQPGWQIEVDDRLLAE